MEILLRQSGEDLGFAHIDRQREARQGFPEVVYAAGKTAAQVTAILSRLAASSKGNVMATRVSPEKAAAVRAALPEAIYDAVSRIVYLRRSAAPVDEARRILVLTAGTSDMPVAAEAALTAELMGNAVGFIAFSRTRTRFAGRTFSSWRQGWRARSPAWWAASRRSRSSPSQRVSAMGPASTACRLSWPCSIPAPPGSL